MCDMQKLPSREDDICEEEDEMNFAAFTTAGGSGVNFGQLTAAGQLPVGKLQQNVTNNGPTIQQVVMGSDGVQYMRTLDGGAALSAAPQIITLPIALPGAKPGDPQQQIQIQVLNPNILQQQPKYQMQIPIQGLQGFQQGGAVLTVAYSPEGNDGGIQLIGNSLPEGSHRIRTGLQLVTMPQEIHLMQSDNKDQIQQAIQQQQALISQNQQFQLMNSGEETKLMMESNNNHPLAGVVIKEECDDVNDDESSQGTETSEGISWQVGNNHDLVDYLQKLPPQQAQALPASLQQFLKMNPAEVKKSDSPQIEIEINMDHSINDNKGVEVTEGILFEESTLRVKKKKKYKKKPPKPAKPKPGQVVITTGSDGSPIYCCPECQLAYPEKEQLEIHLSVHKIERRFICGICGAGLKRKEHLERHKLGHNPERPYVCSVCCKGFKRREHLNLHSVIHSGVKTELCLECGKGFYRKDHLRKHTRSHESKRARDESIAIEHIKQSPAAAAASSTGASSTAGSAEITIHVPTSGNVQVPVQINIPQHVVSSLQAQQSLIPSSSNQNTLDALLAQHS